MTSEQAQRLILHRLVSSEDPEAFCILLYEQVSKRHCEAFAAAVRRIEGGIMSGEAFRIIEWLPKKTGMTNDHFGRLFKKTFGATVIEYAMMRRVFIAIGRLVRYQARTAQKIGEDLGFRDAAHFTKSFFRFTGTTPDKFRHSPPLMNDEFPFEKTSNQTASEVGSR